MKKLDWKTVKRLGNRTIDAVCLVGIVVCVALLFAMCTAMAGQPYEDSSYASSSSFSSKASPTPTPVPLELTYASLRVLPTKAQACLKDGADWVQIGERVRWLVLATNESRSVLLPQIEMITVEQGVLVTGVGILASGQDLWWNEFPYGEGLVLRVRWKDPKRGVLVSWGCRGEPVFSLTPTPRVLGTLQMSEGEAK